MSLSEARCCKGKYGMCSSWCVGYNIRSANMFVPAEGAVCHLIVIPYDSFSQGMRCVMCICSSVTEVVTL